MNAPRLPAWATLLPPLLLCSAALLVLVLDANLALFLAAREALAWPGAAFWSAWTLLGDALVAPLLLVPFLRRRPDLLWVGLLAALTATAFTHLLKPLVHMPRPAAVLDGLTVIGPRLLSGAFPSGHTATAFTLLGILLCSGVLRPVALWSVAVLCATLVGMSRILVGAHWPVDVLAGAAGGWCSALVGLALAQRWPVAGIPSIGRALLGLLALIAVLDLFGHDTGYPAGLWCQHGLAVLALGWLAWDLLGRAEAS